MGHLYYFIDIFDSYKSNTNMSDTEILQFLGKYSLTHVDPQTTIFTEIIPHSYELGEGKLSRCHYGNR